MIKDEFHLKGMTSHRWSQGISKYYLLLALLLKEYLRNFPPFHTPIFLWKSESESHIYHEGHLIEILQSPWLGLL